MNNRYVSDKFNDMLHDFVIPQVKGKDALNLNFQKRGGRIDWKKIAAINIDNSNGEYDIDALQDNIENFVFCSIEKEIDIKSVDTLFIKLFKIGQLIAEYLLHSQTHLVCTINKLKEKSEKLRGDVSKDKNRRRNETEDFRESTRESKKVAQKKLMLEHISTYNCCTYCFKIGNIKIFENSYFLMRHIYRRHPQDFVEVFKTHNFELNHSKTEVIAQEYPKYVEDAVKQEINAIKIVLDETVREIKDYVHMVGNTSVVEKHVSDNIPKISFIQELEERENKIKKLENDFYEQLQELKLKYANLEDMLQNLEKKYVILIESSKEEILQKVQENSEAMYSAKLNIIESSKEQMMEFSKFKTRFEQKFTMLEKFVFKKLEDQCKELENQFSVQKEKLNMEIKTVYAYVESNNIKLNPSQNIIDLERKLEHNLQLLLAKPHRKSLSKPISFLQNSTQSGNKYSKATNASISDSQCGNKSAVEKKNKTRKDITTAFSSTSNSHKQNHNMTLAVEEENPYLECKSNVNPIEKMTTSDVIIATSNMPFQTDGMEGNSRSLGNPCGEGIEIQGNQSYHVVNRLKKELEFCPTLLDGLYDELLGLVDDKLESFGVDKNQTMLKFSVFNETCVLINNEKEDLGKKYFNFITIRDYYAALCEEKAHVMKQHGFKYWKVSSAEPEVVNKLEDSFSSSDTEKEVQFQPSSGYKRISFAEPEVTKTVEYSLEAGQDSCSSFEDKFPYLPGTEDHQTSGSSMNTKMLQDPVQSFVPRPLPRRILPIKSKSENCSSQLQSKNICNKASSSGSQQLNVQNIVSSLYESQQKGFVTSRKSQQQLERYDFLDDFENSSLSS